MLSSLGPCRRRKRRRARATHPHPTEKDGIILARDARWFRSFDETMKLLIGMAMAVLAWSAPMLAQRPGAPIATDAAGLGFDPVRLQRLDAVIQDHVDRKLIAGGIMFIARDGRTAHQRTFGLQDIEAARPMAPDAIFRIASMS